jgi:hypothetical protein
MVWRRQPFFATLISGTDSNELVFVLLALILGEILVDCDLT